MTDVPEMCVTVQDKDCRCYRDLEEMYLDVMTQAVADAYARGHAEGYVAGAMDREDSSCD